VDVYVNKVGPFFNPHETYHYYQLPVCRPNKVESVYCVDFTTVTREKLYNAYCHSNQSTGGKDFHRLITPTPKRT